MEKLPKKRLLIIGPHVEWLRFAVSALSDYYNVTVATGFESLLELEKEVKSFDLIIVTWNLVGKGIQSLSDLARPSRDQWRFIMLFPGFSKERPILFKAGALSETRGPYASGALLRMVEEELNSIKNYVPSAYRKTLARLPIERQIEAFGDAEQREFLECIAYHTRTPKEEIRLAYAIPGSMLVTLEMPEDSALELMRLYLEGSSIIENLGINRVELRPVPTSTPPVPKLPTKPSPSKVSIDYEYGLRQMCELLMEQAPYLQSEFHTLEARLLDYLKDERWFGMSEIVREGRARVVSSLNDLAVRAKLGVSFVDLCKQQ
jgi:hypothetical protein